MAFTPSDAIIGGEMIGSGFLFADAQRNSTLALKNGELKDFLKYS
jgi:hypothetical protein